MSTVKYTLSEDSIPERWYNIAPDLPSPPAPPLHPATKEPIGPDALAPLFPMGVIEQEVSTERWIEIPQAVRDVYRLWRPTPLYRARRLEQALKTPARIYYKYEGVSPAGSHKPNTAVAQAYYNKQEGVKRLTTETGAGQWGSALAFASTLFDLECVVYMVKVSYEQKPYRRAMIESWGAQVTASPSENTEAGRKILAADPDSLGSLGIAISEAVEEAVARDDTKYSLGSVLNHVLLHQTVMGLEAQEQFALAEDYPDVIYGGHGGGSNLAGLVFPFIPAKLSGERPVRLVAVEPEACPTLTKGVYAYDFGDTAGMTPLMKMYTLGHDFVPPGIHAGGLRYHGASPLVSQLVHQGVIEAQAYKQQGIFEAAILFARNEGIMPAPESAHPLKAAIDEAVRCREEGEEKAILVGLSGHGHFDMGSYERYLAGDLENYSYPEAAVAQAATTLEGLQPEA